MQRITSPTKDLLAVATMVLPRMELDFIVDWIGHHRSLGVRQFVVWMDRAPVDAVFGADGNDRVWAKKPHAQYHTYLDDREVRSLFISELDKAESLYDCRIVRRDVAELFAGRALPQYVGTRQSHCAWHSLGMLKSQADWMAFLDVDEYLVGDPWSLCDTKAVAVQIEQLVMQCRWRDRQSVRARSIRRGWGYLPMNAKCIARTGVRSGPWKSPHSLPDAFPAEPTSALRFLHFYGNEALPQQHKDVVKKGDWHYDTATKDRELHAIDYHARPLGGLVLGLPRSGTTLFCDLLDWTGRYHAVGESHVDYSGDRKTVVASVRERVAGRLGHPPLRPIVDKLLDLNQLADPKPLLSLAPNRWIVLRHPLAVWASVVSHDFTAHVPISRIVEQLRRLLAIAKAPELGTRVVSYYDLVRPERLRQWFGVADPATWSHRAADDAPIMHNDGQYWNSPWQRDERMCGIQRVNEQADIEQAKAILAGIPDELGEDSEAVAIYREMVSA